MNLVSRIAGAARLLATGKLAPNSGFDGAQMQRRLVAWRAGGESINSLILQGGEGNGKISRETITVLSGETLQAGAVLGKVTASGKYKALDPAAVDGSEAAAGVLYDAVDASAADAEGVAIVRLAEVNAAELVWPDGIIVPEQTTALGELAALNIIAR